MLKRLRFPIRYVPFAATVAVFIGAYAIGAISFKNFFTLRVFVNLFHDNAYLGIAAVGTGIVILSGGIDLSVGAVIAFTGMLVAKLTACGINTGLAILIALAVGILFGILQGTLIASFDLPPFLVTLGGMFLARGGSFIINEEALSILKNPVLDFIEDNLQLSLGNGVYLECIEVVYLIVLLCGIVFTQWTPLGRRIYAIGVNEQSALLMGVPVARTKIMAYGIAGFCSALAGIVFTVYLKSGNPLNCIGLEMDAIAAVVIGGILLTGGVGYLLGSLFGVLTLGLIQVLIMFQGNINSWWTRIIIGILVLLFIFMQNLITKLSDKKQ
ncbi:MAG: sugar ABC transporter permease YjfF [Lentisphaerae bacterium]|jgi:ribose/xylose/arabinose/galactoside ABC-type transport system permease subunit|nr:sugar ABC transporter permease YjfF [Lentisphaerota bacterium]